MGFCRSIKSENIIGQTFGKSTNDFESKISQQNETFKTIKSTSFQHPIPNRPEYFKTHGTNIVKQNLSDPTQSNINNFYGVANSYSTKPNTAVRNEFFGNNNGLIKTTS